MRFPEPFSDVEVTLASLPAEMEGTKARGVLWQAASGRFQIEIPHQGRVRVEEGRRVTLDLDPARADPLDDAQFPRAFGLAPLAALCYQRGMLALHAAGVVPPAREDRPPGAHLLAGDSGAGKSSLAAALARQGWKLVCDELAMIDLDPAGGLRVWPTPGSLALWPRSIQALGLETPPTAQPNGRCWVQGVGQWEDAPLRVNALTILTIHSVNTVEQRVMAGLERFSALSAVVYNSHIADALLDRGATLRLGAGLARLPLYQHLARPRGKWTLDELAATLVAAGREG